MRSLPRSVRGILPGVALAVALLHSPLSAGDWLFVSLLNKRQIVSFQRHPQTGALTRRVATLCPAEPAFLSVSPDQRTLFVAFRSTGQLASFRIDSGTGVLIPLSVVAGGEDPAFLLADHRNRFLLSAYYIADKVSVHRISAAGQLLAEPLQTIVTGDKAHGIAINPANTIALVSHTGANRVHPFRFNPSTGKLTPSDPAFVESPAGYHPRHIEITPNGRWAYAGNEAGDSISAYEIDPSKATLKLMQTLPTIPSEFDGEKNSTARCAMTANGRFIYVANRGHDSIAGFAIDAQTGRLTALGQTATEKTPRSFAIDPQDRFLYAAGQNSGKLAAYRIAENGKLRRVATYDVGPVPWGVAVSKAGSRR